MYSIYIQSDVYTCACVNLLNLLMCVSMCCVLHVFIDHSLQGTDVAGVIREKCSHDEIVITTNFDPTKLKTFY